MYWIVARYMIPVLQECELFWCWTRTLVPRCCSPATRAETPVSYCRHDAAASSRSTTASWCQGWEATTCFRVSSPDEHNYRASWPRLWCFLTYIRKVPNSNLGQITDHMDWGFLWFSSISPHKCRDSSLKWTTTAYFDILSNSSLIILLFDTLCFWKSHTNWKQLSLLPPPSSVANVVVWLLMQCLPLKLEVRGMSMIFLLL